MTNAPSQPLPTHPFEPAAPPPPPSPPRPLEPARRSVLLAAAVGAVATDLAMWTTSPGLLWVAGACVAAGAVAIATRPTTPAAWGLLASVPLLAVWCAVRSSPWLVVPDVIAINVCLVLAASHAHRGRWTDQSLMRIVNRLAEFAATPFTMLPWAAPLLRQRLVEADGSPRTPRDHRATLTALVVTVPLVVVLILLLASADAVFASFFDIGIDSSVVARHVLFLLGGAWAVAALARHGANLTEDRLSPAPTLRATTANALLGGLVAVFTLYATSRLLTLTGAAERIATTRGLTWAEYARSGFFQLLAVAVITLIVLLSVRGFAGDGTPAQRSLLTVLALTSVALVIGIVVDAVYRLDGYADAYGLTMLRLYSTWFAIWIGAVFLVVGAAFVVGYAGRRWLAPTLVASLLPSLFLLNAVNPEALVAARNLQGSTEVGTVDLDYLLDDLGGDAIPTVAHNTGTLSRLDSDTLDYWCDGDLPDSGPFGWNVNLSVEYARDARSDLCR